MPRVTSMIEEAMTNSSLLESSSYKRQAENYANLLNAFAALLQREDELLTDVFPREFQSNVFNKLVELPLTYMKEKAETICQAIEKAPHKLDPAQSAIDGLIGILKWFIQSMSKYSKLYQVTSEQRDSAALLFSLTSFGQDRDGNRRNQLTTLSMIFQKLVCHRERPLLIEKSIRFR